MCSYPIIANIVATSNLGTKINLNFLKEKIPEISYNPRKFAAGILKIKDPIKVTFLIWASGKIICLELKRIGDCEIVFREFVNNLNILGFKDIKYSEYIIQNLVSSFDWRNKINLGELRGKYPKFAFYEPEIFCGLHFKAHSRIICLVFTSGKIVITGAKDLDEIDFMYKKIKKYLL